MRSATQSERVVIARYGKAPISGLCVSFGTPQVRLRGAGRARSKGDQVITVPDADVLFTGDLAEAGQFAIFPWFPPHDTVVSGLGWIEVTARLAAAKPRTTVPGHGDIGGTQVLEDVLGYLRELLGGTWAHRDSAMGQETIVLLVEHASEQLFEGGQLGGSCGVDRGEEPGSAFVEVVDGIDARGGE